MNTAPFWVSIALLVPRALAAPADSSAAAAAPSCTASLITSLCDYPNAGPEFSVASSGKAHCWDYCNAHPPCNFAIFSAGNPYTGSGACLLYPGETFDASKGSTDCGNPALSVYDKPVCPVGTATTTAGACAATASPSAVASVCGYPSPPDNCQSSCYASSGSADCLSICAKADSCNYAVFKALSPSKSPYSAGSCWIYTEGKFNPGAATACTGAPDQFVYNNLDNVCPKPSPTSSSLKPSATAPPSGTGTAGATTGSTNSATTNSHGTGSTGSSGTGGDTTGSTNGSGTNSNGSGTGSSTNGTGTSSNGTGTKSNGTETAAASATTTDSAAVGLSLTNPLAMGAAVLILLAL
ncbi:hypothetical protein VE02_03098 [Pseudogymnoascus sp. 03VT05]|nr:hypothetical protein VE02_03098 [Pseudogymnoascus sp. 03VT05]